MFVILKEDHTQNETTVVDIIYGDNSHRYIENHLNYLWHLFDGLESENVNFYIDKESCSIIKKESHIEKGYIYTTKKEINTLLFTVRALEYNPKSLDNISPQPISSSGRLWENLNREINHRVLKSMDKDSLYQIFVELDKNMKIKTNWSTNDYINILNELLKNFRKDLYSSIAKKLKRYSSKHMSYKR